MIMMWHSSTAPDGWAICNGQELPDGTHAPDLRGRFIRGIDVGKKFGDLGGSDTSTSSVSISLTSSNLPPHTHTVKYGRNAGNGHSNCQWAPTAGCQGPGNWADGTIWPTETTGVGTPATATTPAFPIVPKYFSVYYIIKL